MGEVALMAIELPASPKVYTTKYDNFKGVDFTNDATNVWRRRSPSAVNMLPDESGRPFKRHGWSILLSNADICTALGVPECRISKCAYFELAGVDHIVVFTDNGVLFYNGDENATDYTIVGVTAINTTDYACYSGYDRCFFFEGDGTSAFYIYGDFKVWRYESDFQLHDVTSQVTAPTLLIGTSAGGVGTFYSGYNLLGTRASIEYNDCALLTYWCSDGLSITVDEEAFKAGKTINNVDVYRWTWDGATWVDTNNTGVSFPSSQITVTGTKKEDDEIIVLYINGVMLPNNVDQSDITMVKVNASVSMQYDLPLTVRNSVYAKGSMVDSDCKLWTDDTLNRESGRAWIQFKKAWTEVVSGEDFIKVEFPSVSVKVTPYPKTGEESNCRDNGTASLVGA